MEQVKIEYTVWIFGIFTLASHELTLSHDLSFHFASGKQVRKYNSRKESHPSQIHIVFKGE